MIEIKARQPGSAPHWSIGKYFLVIAGEELGSSDVIKTVDKKFSAWINSEIDSKKLLTQILADLEMQFHALTIELDRPVDRWVRLQGAFVAFNSPPPDTLRRKLVLFFKPDFDNWINPFSALDYQRALKEAAVGSFVDGSIFAEDVTDGFSVTRALAKAEDVTVAVKIAGIVDEVKRLSTKAVEGLFKRVQKDSLVAWFDFPAPIRAACEQYLIYFIQFLEDLGIKANSEIKADAGRILFSVTPKEGSSALERIKEALEIYLNLPVNSEFNAAAEQFKDISVSQLKSQVLFLHSQLHLAKATLQAKDAAIHALDFTVFQQRQLLAGRKRDDSASNKEDEPILGDTIHITQYEGKAFRVDLPTILRRLKRSFGIGQGKSTSSSALPPSRDREPE
jgi:hypothetical protein